MPMLYKQNGHTDRRTNGRIDCLRLGLLNAPKPLIYEKGGYFAGKRKLNYLDHKYTFQHEIAQTGFCKFNFQTSYGKLKPVINHLQR